MDQAVAARQIEQPVAQMREARRCAVLRTRRARQSTLDIETLGLIAISLEPLRQRVEIGGALVPVERRHLRNQCGDDRVERTVEPEQVRLGPGEPGDILLIVQIESARETGEDQPDDEDVQLARRDGRSTAPTRDSR